MSEEFALEHPFGEPAHIHRDHWPAGAGARGMYPAGCDFLADSVLPQDKRVGVGGRHPGHQFGHLAHRGRFRDQIREAVAP